MNIYHYCNLTHNFKPFQTLIKSYKTSKSMLELLMSFQQYQSHVSSSSWHCCWRNPGVTSPPTDPYRWWRGAIFSATSVTDAFNRNLPSQIKQPLTVSLRMAACQLYFMFARLIGWYHWLPYFYMFYMLSGTDNRRCHLFRFV